MTFGKVDKWQHSSPPFWTKAWTGLVSLAGVWVAASEGRSMYCLHLWFMALKHIYHVPRRDAKGQFAEMCPNMLWNWRILRVKAKNSQESRQGYTKKQWVRIENWEMTTMISWVWLSLFWARYKVGWSGAFKEPGTEQTASKLALKIC